MERFKIKWDADRFLIPCFPPVQRHFVTFDAPGPCPNLFSIIRRSCIQVSFNRFV
jgi:hypothetical protein